MIDLSPYLTRPADPEVPGTRDVFCVHNLPTEIVSVLFGKYSRSQLGLRAEMAMMLQETQDLTATKGTSFDLASEKAGKFHALYTLGYGHSSLGDGAFVHIAIENCSMLAAKVLEDARLAAFIEKSTRYVKFDPHQSPDLAGWGVLPEHADRVRDAFGTLLRAYETFTPKVRAHAAQSFERPVGMKDAAWEKLLDTKTFDLCRGLLPFGARTSLGMAMDARELAHCLQKWSESPFAEVRDIAERIRLEASKVVPTLLKHSQPTGYYTNLRERLLALGRSYERGGSMFDHNDCLPVRRVLAPTAGELPHRILDQTEMEAARLTPMQQLALLKKAILDEHPGIFSVVPAEKLLAAYVEGHTLHEQPGRALEVVTYPNLCFGMDLGAWRDMQRHRMATQLSYNALPDHVNRFDSTLTDYLDPFWAEDNSFDALRDQYHDVMRETQRQINRCLDLGTGSSWVPALYPLSAFTEWRPTLNLREAIYVVERRSVPEGHPTYRRTAQQLAQYLYSQLPVLEGKLHVDTSMPTFARQAAIQKST